MFLKLFKTCVLLAAWLVFGGAYVVDAFDLSYEMRQGSAPYAQAVEPDDDGKSNALPVFCAALESSVAHVDLLTPPKTTFTRTSCEIPAPGLSLHQRLSIYRI